MIDNELEKQFQDTPNTMFNIVPEVFIIGE